MMRDIGYLEANCYIYSLDSSNSKKFDGEGLLFDDTKTKLYFVFQKLWKTVVPGSFSVKNFKINSDPGLVSFGPDPMDMLAFTGNSKIVVLLTNPTTGSRKLTIKP